MERPASIVSSCVELRQGADRLVLDLGLPLDAKRDSNVPLPGVPGLELDVIWVDYGLSILSTPGAATFDILKHGSIAAAPSIGVSDVAVFRRDNERGGRGIRRLGAPRVLLSPLVAWVSAAEREALRR